jgi:hypothetical protein
MDRRKSVTLWKCCVGILVLTIGVIVCGILGFMVGTYVGGNYAQNFMFLEIRGYEAAGLLGLIIGAIAGGAINLGLVVAYFKAAADPLGNMETENESNVTVRPDE